MKPQTYRLPGGTGKYVHISHTDKFKTSRLSLLLSIPADSGNYIKSMLCLLVSRRGTEEYPELAVLNRWLDELYSTTLTIRDFMMNNSHVIGMTCEMLDSRFLPENDDTDIIGGALEIMSQLLLHPRTDSTGILNEATVESEKKNLIDSIRAQRNDTQTYAMLRFRGIMYDGLASGISVLDREDEVTAVSASSLTAFMKNMLMNVRADFYYTGSADSGEIIKKITDAFGGFEPSPVKSGAEIRKNTRNTVTRVNEDMPVSQGKLCMGFRYRNNIEKSDMYPETIIMNELYGVMNTSRLFMNLRERMGLCYSIGSSFDIGNGAIILYCGIRPENKDKAENEAVYQLKRIADGDIPEEELEAAKKSVYTAYSQISDSPVAIESYWYSRIINPDQPLCGTPEECMDKFKNVSAADVACAASGFVLDTVYFLNGTAPDTEGDDYDE